MPMTKKGDSILKSMRRFYGKRRGTEVFYRSINKGRLRGTHRKGSRWEKQAARGYHKRGRKAVYTNRYKLSPKHREAIAKGLRRYHRGKKGKRRGSRR